MYDDSDSEDQPISFDSTDDKCFHPRRGPLCPITHAPMTDPVKTCDGHVFERVAIFRHLLASDLSPVTNKPLESIHLIPEGSKSQAAAWYRLALVHKTEELYKDRPRAVALFWKAAAQGHLDALYELGQYYEGGEGEHGPRSLNLACKLYQRAAEGGHVDARFQYAYCLDEGRGCNRDDERALFWYTRAADAGHLSACFNLGLMYLSGRGVEKDASYAFDLFARVAKTDDAQAHAMLALMYSNGEGVHMDDSKALRHCIRAAEKGDQEAIFTLGTWYLTGKHVHKDVAKGLEMLHELASAKDREACLYLSAWYKDTDRTKSVGFLRMATLCWL